MKNKKIIFVFAFFLMIIAIDLCFADILIEKEAVNQINYGEVLNVKITLSNNASATQVSLIEYIEESEVISPIDKLVVPEPIPGKIALEPSYLFWEFSLDAGSEKIIEYQIKPKNVGDFVFSPTEALTDGGVFYSNPLSVKVISVPNGRCEQDIGENYLNSQDCPSGSQDGICDGIIDGKCDIDCSAGADIECSQISKGATGKEINLQADVMSESTKLMLWVGIPVVVFILILILVIILAIKAGKKKKQDLPIPMPVKESQIPLPRKSSSSDLEIPLPPKE